jgi:cytoskeletal protein CcmA (bactofilin family)
MPTLTTVNVTSASTLIFGGQGSTATPIQVVNLDTENTVWFSYLSNPQANQPGSFPLGPLASMSFTGTVSVWGVSESGETIVVGVIPGGSNYSPGSLTISGPVTATISGPVTVEGTVDIAGTTDVQIQNANIDVVGAGGFINPGQIGNLVTSGPLTVGANSSIDVATDVNVENYTSLTFLAGNMTNSSTAAGAAVCAVLEITWTNSAGVAVATDTLSTALGGDAGATWEVPIKSSFFSIICINPGTVGTITLPSACIYVDGSYRTLPNIRVVSCTLATPTLTGCVVVAQSKPVGDINTWIASLAYSWTGANTNVVILLPQWAGQVTGFYQVITTALAKNATIVDLSYAVQGQVVSGSGYTFGIIQNIPSAIDTNPVDVSFNLPPTQCALILSTPAATGEFFLSLAGVGN